MVKEQCGNCRFYREWECHRHAPVVIQFSNNVFGTGVYAHGETAYPHTQSDSWCGDWEQKDYQDTGETDGPSHS